MAVLAPEFGLPILRDVAATCFDCIRRRSVSARMQSGIECLVEIVPGWA
ncbi:MAG TPA: hypothetical protein VKT49_10475 [Bryobacteraceae bacterium]|nr:hypothetical protein [Bryobacteraceae bacterium]